MFHGGHVSVWIKIFRRFGSNYLRLSKAESRLVIAEQGLKSECGELYSIL